MKYDRWERSLCPAEATAINLRGGVQHVHKAAPSTIDDRVGKKSAHRLPGKVDHTVSQALAALGRCRGS